MKPTFGNRIRLLLHTLSHGHRRVTLWRVLLTAPPQMDRTAIYCECGYGKESPNVD